MQKRKNSLFIYNVAVGQISLIIFSVFAFAFIISEAQFVSGQKSAGTYNVLKGENL